MDRAVAIPELSVEQYFKATPLGVVALCDVPYEIWAAYGQGMQRIHGSMPFILGDWLNYGERVYGETYAAAIAYTDLRAQTLMNYKWVASRVPISLRRENLSWTHHALIASMQPEEQELWLAASERENWSTDELRTRLKEAHGAPDGWLAALDKLFSLIEQALGKAERQDDIAALRLMKDLVADIRERSKHD